MKYCIVEVEDGWSVADCRDNESASDCAERLGGTLLDPAQYSSYEEAQEAMVALQDELDDETISDLPGTRAWDGRDRDD